MTGIMKKLDFVGQTKQSEIIGLMERDVEYGVMYSLAIIKDAEVKMRNSMEMEREIEMLKKIVSVMIERKIMEEKELVKEFDNAELLFKGLHRLWLEGMVVMKEIKGRVYYLLSDVSARQEVK
jgi:hypothetical protein